ncbi:MAG: MFS transporter [Ignavibacteria bacterium]|nr:MFS transporter [Ignavibacteria bacterium]MBT8381939.1 MFS transporter [Ignavibacteria bacterium]MBT8392776.1 MFS transporter [Ignavibacteria bacterium]NNJ54337.1 MFS transporter [Ignavibacteriaceae bacterium]NNL22029.1 MFS transporter [Ignavibacteriaceae bacterium]
MPNNKSKERNPWFWIPSLYLAEGLPYVVVMTVSVIMYKRLEISNTEIALYTSWLYLPWVIKPFWSPVVDLLKTKRFWIVVMQFFIGAGLAGVALTLPTENFFKYTLAFFWLMAFSSATHDIAADGFYMLGLKEHEQAFFVGIRATFYRIAFIAGQGLLVILAGQIEVTSGDIPYAWMITFFILAGMFILFFTYHLFVLPYPKSDLKRSEVQLKKFFNEFVRTFASFFKKKEILLILLFVLFYRFAEAQLVKMASPFLLDEKDVGGLALTTSQVGLVYGTVGVIALSLGGILGGIAAARNGLKFWIWWMLIAINLPNVVYVYLAITQTSNFLLINISVAIEQFGYGFGFTAFMLYLIYISEGEFKTAHYAIATGFMALGMMLPGMISGWIQEQLGYQNFFIWICISTIPAFIITKLINIDPLFGKKISQNNE